MVVASAVVIVPRGSFATRQEAVVSTDVMVHNSMRGDIVRLMPPEDIDDKRADAVAKCVELQ